MYIYKITNLINGKIYIGKCKKTVNKSKKYFGSGSLINKAIKKYGIENFEKTILIETENYKELNELEKKYIKDFNPEYNISSGGDGGNNGNQFTNPIGKVNKPFDLMTEEEKNKHLNEKYRGKNHYLYRCKTEEEREEFLNKFKRGKNNPRYGYKWTDEEKKRHSEILSGRSMPKLSNEHKNKISIANAKTYKITFNESNESIIINCLSKYCRDNNISVYKLNKISIIERI